MRAIGAWFGRLLRNPRASQIASFLFVVLLVAAWATKCHGADLQFGMGSTIARGATPVLDVAVTTRRGAPLDANWQFGLTLIGSSTYGEVDQPNQAALSALLVDGFGPLDIGLGAVFLQNTDIYNGSHANFALQLAYRFQRLPLTVTVRHWSNAGTVQPNLGRDFVLLSWRFR